MSLSGEKGSRVKVPHEPVAVMKESCFRCICTVIGEGREDGKQGVDSLVRRPAPDDIVEPRVIGLSKTTSFFRS